jgi:hypothetical protein
MAAISQPKNELFIEFKLASTLDVILTAPLGWSWSKTYVWAPKWMPYLQY